MSQLVQFGASERVSRVNWGLQSAYRQSIGSAPGLQSAFRESIGSVQGFRAHFASQLVQFRASERVSRVNWFSSGLQSAFRESIGSVSGLQSAFRESIGSVRGFRARFASQLGASERVLRVNWFSAGLQSAFASQLVKRGASERVSRVILVQVGASERVLRVNWFSSGHQSVFRESIGV